jgi:hypothetical protein
MRGLCLPIRHLGGGRPQSNHGTSPGVACDVSGQFPRRKNDCPKRTAAGRPILARSSDISLADGDTITVLRGEDQVRVRRHGID